jgi:predicted nucleic acid-binding protein
MIVVDSSVITTALADDGDDGARSRSRLAGERLVAPELLDLEVASALRKLVAARSLSARRARLALDDLLDLRCQRAPHRPLLGRLWELRGNLTVYDAAYVALAEHLEVVLVTADRRLARAPRVRCAVEVLA